MQKPGNITMAITCLVPVNYELLSWYEPIATDRTLEDLIHQALVFAHDNKDFWVEPLHTRTRAIQAPATSVTIV